MTAVGIHAHDSLKLGLSPHSKSKNELLQVRFKEGATPRAAVDNMSAVHAAMYDNDQIGDCGPTALCNHRRISSLVETGHQHNVELRKCIELYSEVSGYDPETGANDNGVENPALLAAARKYGVGNEKLAAYGQLQVTDDNSFALAIDIFGAVLVAVDLEVAQQRQTADGFWDYSSSGEWGGHDIVFGAYDSAGGATFDCFSWARRIHTTAEFRAHQLSEIWIPMFPGVLKSDKFNNTVDTDQLASDFQNLTGQSLSDALF